MTYEQRDNCTECGLPTLLDDYGTCNACHEKADQQGAMKVFDNYEISPCRRYEEPDSPGKFYFEVCDPHEADVWTLYGHVNGEGVQAIGDFAKREAAEEVFFRITGMKFTGSYRANAHLRLMHAAQKLLIVLMQLAMQVDEDCPPVSRTRHFSEALDEAYTVIAQATGRAV